MARTLDKSPTILYAASQNFSGGMNSAADPRSIDQLQCQSVVNGYIAGSFHAVKRPGFVSLLQTPFSAPVREMRRFQSHDYAGEYNFSGSIVWEGPNVWALDDDGNLTLLYSGIILDTYNLDVAVCEYGGEVYFSIADHGLMKVACASDAAVSAHVEAGVVGTIDTAGSAGNAYDLVVQLAATPSQPLSVGLSGTTITITLATDGSGANNYAANTQTLVAAELEGNVPIAAVSSWVVSYGDQVVEGVGTYGFWGGADLYGMYAAIVNSTDFSILATREGSERIFGVDFWNTSALMWCDALTPGTWAGANIWAPGGAFTGIIEIQGVLVCEQPTRTMRIDGTDPATWTTARASAEGVGLPVGATRTLRELEGIAVYLSRAGVTTYDGYAPSVLSNPIKNRQDGSANFVPLTDDMWTGSFSLVWNDYIMFFYRSGAGVTGCDRAILYDFRASVWSGVWEFAVPVNCAVCDAAEEGPGGRLTLGLVTGDVVQEAPSGCSAADTFDFTLRSRTFDCARPMLDKQVIEMRCRYYAPAATSITFSLYREGESTPIETVTHTVAAAGPGVIAKRVRHFRGTDFYFTVETSDGVHTEIAGLEFDYFFVKAR